MSRSRQSPSPASGFRSTAPSSSPRMAACSSAVLATYTYSEAGPVSSSCASRRIVTRRSPSARIRSTAVAMMPAWVSAGLEGRSRRLRGAGVWAMVRS